MVVVGELSVVELLVHVGVGDEVVEKIDEDEVGDVDYEEEFENGIALSEYGGSSFFEAEDRLDELHF